METSQAQDRPDSADTSAQILLQTVSLAKSYIQKDTTAGKELEALIAIEDWSKLHGFKTEQVATPGLEDRYNLLVTHGKPEILFSTHIDTVPVDHPEQLKPIVRFGRLYGRGACDTKGILATIMMSMKKLKEEGAENFGMLIVSDEEISGQGAQAASAALSDRGIEYLINGEPTENKTLTAHRGSYGFKIEITGRAGHSGYPGKFIDANDILIRFRGALTKAAEEGKFGNVDALNGVPTINYNNWHAHGAKNVVPGKAETEVFIRTVESAESIREFCTQFFKDFVYNIPDQQGGVCILPKITERAEKLPILGLISVPGLGTGVANYGTDLPYFRQMSKNYLLYGPGSILDAHTNNESISLAQMEQALTDFPKIFYYLKSRLQEERAEN